MTRDPLATGLLTLALVIATFLYGLLIRRRHADEIWARAENARDRG